MTQNEKINSFKPIIVNLYEKEGRNISYISRIIEVDRSSLSKKIREWELVKAQKRHIKPSTQKFINKNSSFIIVQMKADVPMSEIARELNIGRDKLYYIIENDPILSAEKEAYSSRITNKKVDAGKERNYFEDLPNEQWKKILGFSNYYVSNMGRFKKYLIEYDCFRLLKLSPNSRNGRLYIRMVDDNGRNRNMNAARIIAHAFCDGYSKTNNTVDHKDMDVTNNRADNLEWVSQSENNKRKNLVYGGHKGYSRNGKFKEIVLNNTYHFKTICALARFLGVSETQANRYVSGETKFDGEIELIY